MEIYGEKRIVWHILIRNRTRKARAMRFSSNHRQMILKCLQVGELALLLGGMRAHLYLTLAGMAGWWPFR